MRKTYPIACLFLLSLMLAFPEYLYSTHGKPRNDVRPNFRLVLTPRFFADSNAISMLGEAGARTWRLNGTYGCYLNPSDRFKIGAEYLREQLTYQFTPGDTKQWVHQYAFGGIYQHIFQCYGVYSFDIGGRYSQAQSKHLSDVIRPLNEAKLQPKETFRRRIAGSNAWEASMGFTLVPWDGASFGLAAVYDHVKYKKKYNTTNKIDSGAGAALSFVQYIASDIQLGAKAEFRCPYTYLEAEMNWHTCVADWGGVTLGVYAGHTRGRNRLPDSTEGGIQLGVDFGVENAIGSCCSTSSGGSCLEGCRGTAEYEYLAWLAAPAVYMPQVLAKSDLEVVEPCVSPTSTPIPNFTASGSPPFFIFTTPLAQYFNNYGNVLTYSATLAGTGTVTHASASIDSTSGQLYVAGYSTGTVTVTVTGKNICGSTSQTFTVTFQ